MNKNQKLTVLKEVTSLDFISKIRIGYEFWQADRERELLAGVDRTHCYSADYSRARELEYELRMRILKNNLSSAWSQYSAVEKENISLNDFAESYIDDYVETNSKGRTFKL